MSPKRLSQIGLAEAWPFVQILTEARVRGGFTQREVADRAAVDSSAVSKWETGQAHPGIGFVAAWADAVGLRLVLVKKEEDHNGH